MAPLGAAPRGYHAGRTAFFGQGGGAPPRVLYFSPVSKETKPAGPQEVEDARRAREAEDAARLAAIVAGAEDAIVSKTLEGIVTSWNPAAESMFGYTAEEAIGRPITIVIPLDRMHEEREILARLRRGERTEHFETIRVHKSGREIPVSLTVSPVRDPTGRVIGASKIARDRTEQQRAHEALRATVRGLEALYRLADRVGRAADRAQIHEAALDAITTAMGVERASILLFDLEGAMRFVAWRGLSDAYRRATDGHSPWRPDSPEHAPITVFDVFQDASLASLRDAVLAEGIRALLFVPIEWQGRLIGKFMVYADVPRAFSSDECRLAETIGRHVAFGLVRVDTERAANAALARERAARAEADAARTQAESANREKDEFLAMLAHELRNPLGPIVHAAEILGRHDELDEEPRRAIAMIDRQARHMARLLEDLLDVARITRGRISLRSETVDLREPVEHAVEAHRPAFEAKGQRVSLGLPDGPVLVLGDAARLQQVVGNLLHNARKYTPQGGAIRVDLFRGGSTAEVQVEDDGIGVAREHLQSIFDLFVQANPTLARTEGGLGVGLTLVRGVVDLHGGAGLGRERRARTRDALHGHAAPDGRGAAGRASPDDGRGGARAPHPGGRGQRRRARGARDAAPPLGPRGRGGGHRPRGARLGRAQPAGAGAARHRPARSRRLPGGGRAPRLARRPRAPRRAHGLRTARRPRARPRRRLRRAPAEARRPGCHRPHGRLADLRSPSYSPAAASRAAWLVR